MRNMKCYVMNRGLLPPPKNGEKKIKKTSVYLFHSLSLPPSISVHPSHPPQPFHITTPPLTLTLACLSGLLPCIPPFPVWPLSQEVAQLVDKHHGGDGEEGLGNSRPLRLCQYSAGKKMERSRGGLIRGRRG